MHLTQLQDLKDVLLCEALNVNKTLVLYKKNSTGHL